MFFQANNEQTILQCVQQIGPAVGAQQMLKWEFKHAQEAIDSGVYITWVCDDQSKGDCFRIGSQSNCFCGHRFSSHELILKKAQKTNCKDCKCAEFKFMPRRPEEIGQGHLPRRKGFDINVWRPSCKCKHTHEQHTPVKPFKCKACGCGQFVSDFACINCEMKYEDHFTVFELEKERKAAKKAIREDFMPLATSPEIQQEVMKKLKLDGRTAEERFLEEIKRGDQEESKQIVLTLQEDGAGGIAQRPQVQYIIERKQNFAPKQNLAKPEKSIQLMQQRGIAGLGNTTNQTANTVTMKPKTTSVPKAGGFMKSSVPKMQ
ncbi:UNKNOWN [Stylonychia lemnae]|uniref:Uncharacterized protein n=1 Tax=Stylonychia lemnae TaxID=5949 RepID=A0A078B414_STYLE|nr:UNKNOWN [Stylonychia lemnae]|eukprot:CDW88981.1 UNKNOWN [Stylonychia lemnae]